MGLNFYHVNHVGEKHEETSDFDPAEQRREIAEKMAARGYASPLGGAGPQTPEETAEHFGREMFRLHGRAWPLMSTLASGAAMQAERDAIAAADYVEGRG